MTRTIRPSDDRGILLSAMDADDIAAMFAASHRKTYPAGSTIFSEGEPGSTVILIEEGRAEISMTALSGRKSVLAHMGPGEVLGEIAALDGGLRTADAVAASAVTGRVLSRENVMDFVSAHPPVARAVISALCSKVRNATDMYAVQAEPEGSARLARAMLRLFDQWGAASHEGVRLAERFSQSEIGEFCGLARENVNRHVKAWVASEVLRIDGRQLILLDRGALEVLAAG